MWFVAFYERAGVGAHSFVSVKQDLQEPLEWLDGSLDRDELDGYAVGDVVRAKRRVTGHTVEGEITVIQPDGRYSVKGEGESYYLYQHHEIEQVLEESHDGEPQLMGVIAHPNRSAAVKIRNWVCGQFDQDPDLTHEWWPIVPAKLRDVARELGEDLWIPYDPSFTVEEFQQTLSEL